MHSCLQGIGTELTRKCVELSVERGYTRITLHASDYGRPIYEKMGFKPTTEMRLLIDKKPCL
jgi:ribosomal protein S18 acetylase RimI-like enzyme